jgi:hypothetical protein
MQKPVLNKWASIAAWTGRILSLAAFLLCSYAIAVLYLHPTGYGAMTSLFFNIAAGLSLLSIISSFWIVWLAALPWLFVGSYLMVDVIRAAGLSPGVFALSLIFIPALLFLASWLLSRNSKTNRVMNVRAKGQ